MIDQLKNAACDAAKDRGRPVYLRHSKRPVDSGPPIATYVLWCEKCRTWTETHVEGAGNLRCKNFIACRTAFKLGKRLGLRQWVSGMMLRAALMLPQPLLRRFSWLLILRDRS